MDVTAAVTIATFSAFFLLFFVALPVSLSMRRTRLHREWWAVLLAWAHRHGWTVTQDPSVDWTARLPGQRADGVSLLVSGAVDGRPVALAQYSYTTASTVMVGNTMTPSSTTHECVVCLARVPAELRHLSIAVEHRSGLSKLGRRIAGDSPTAIGNEEFDRRFKVWAQPAEVAQRVIGPALAAELLAGHLTMWSLQNGMLIAYHEGRIGDPDTFDALLAPLIRVATLLGR
jgi:hypothetical protein